MKEISDFIVMKWAEELVFLDVPTELLIGPFREEGYKS